jgi:hypothetical protein
MGDERVTGVSPGGSQVYQYDKPASEGWSAPAQSRRLESLQQHFDRFFGEGDSVFHEIVSDLVHIDVHMIAPRPERDWWTLYTTGMSDRPMTVPWGAAEKRFAELILALPPGWKIDSLKATPAPEDLERWYWPFRWIKTLARFPHEYRTWLGPGHTIPNGDPPKPFAPTTRMCGWLLLPPVNVDERAAGRRRTTVAPSCCSRSALRRAAKAFRRVLRQRTVGAVEGVHVARGMKRHTALTRFPFVRRDSGGPSVAMR